MKPEDRLDQLIGQYEKGARRPLVRDDETTPLVEAAARLARLRSMNVPPAFARKLEGEIRARARAQQSSQQDSHDGIIPFVRPRPASRPPRSFTRRLQVAIIVCVMALLIVSASLLVATVRNPANNSLSNPAKTATQVENTLQNNPQDSANVTIQRLHASIIYLNTVVHNQQDDNAILQALNAVSAWTSTGQEQVAALPTSSELPTIQQNLAREIGQEKQTLYLLLAQVDWSIKLAFTQQLGVLGEPVPTVIAVSVQNGSTGTLLVTLTGTHFSSQAQLVIDGKLTGTISQVSAQKLVATIHNTGHFSGTHTLGILNPNGTAAQQSYNVFGNTSTPTPSPTPTTPPTPSPTPTTPPTPSPTPTTPPTPTPTPTHNPDS